MRKKIWSIVSAILMFMLLANSCRQEHVISGIHSEKERTDKFQIFARTHGLQQYAAKGAADMHYQEGIRYLYYKYFELHPEDAPDFTNHEIPHVDFRYATQVFYEEDSSKVVFFPIVRNGKVIELLGAHLNPEDTYLTFVFHEEDEFRANALEEFASHKIDDPDTYGGIGHPIEGVVITVIKPLTNADFPKGLVDYTMPGSGNCAFYGDCGGGSGSVMPPLPTVQNPCEKIKKVGKNQKTKNLMNDLKTKTGDNKEHGQVLVEENNVITPIDLPPGTPGDADINFSITGQIDGIIHSHYTGLLDVFSMYDIFSAAQLYHNGNIYDVNTFIVGVVTASGTQYLMVIDNPTKFGNFASGIMNGNQIDKDAYDIMLGTFEGDGFGILPQNNLTSNENNFVNFLEIFNTGLKMVKGSSDFNNWSVLNQNSSGTVAPQNCP